jgi:uncharacterized protein YoxC
MKGDIMSKPEIEAILQYMNSLEKQMDNFRTDAHDLLYKIKEELQGDLKELVQVVNSLATVVNTNKIDIQDLQRRIKSIEAGKTESKKTLKIIALDIIRYYIIPIGLMLTILYLGWK